MLVRDESLKKQGCADGTGMARRAGVGEVGDIRIEHGQVGPPQWHAPERILGLRSGGEQGVGDFVAVAEQRRQVGTESDAGRAGQVAKSRIRSGFVSPA